MPGEGWFTRSLVEQMAGEAADRLWPLSEEPWT